MTLATSPSVNTDSPPSHKAAGPWTHWPMRQKLQALIDERKKKQGSSTPRKHFRFKTAPAMDWQHESPMAIVTSAAEGAHDSAATNETNTDSEMTDSSTETALSCSKDTGDLEGMDWEPSSCIDQSSDTLVHSTDEDSDMSG